MSKAFELEVRILGGLPVLALGRIFPPEPDVGIFHEQIEVDELRWVNGGTLPNKVVDRISSKGWDDIHQTIAEYSHEEPDYD